MVSHTIPIPHDVRIVWQEHDGCQHWSRNWGSCCSIVSFQCSTLFINVCSFVLFHLAIVLSLFLRISAFYCLLLFWNFFLLGRRCHRGQIVNQQRYRHIDSNKNVDIKVSDHKAFVKYSSVGTLITKRLKNLIIQKVFESK